MRSPQLLVSSLLLLVLVANRSPAEASSSPSLNRSPPAARLSSGGGGQNNSLAYMVYLDAGIPVPSPTELAARLDALFHWKVTVAAPPPEVSVTEMPSGRDGEKSYRFEFLGPEAGFFSDLFSSGNDETERYYLNATGIYAILPKGTVFAHVTLRPGVALPAYGALVNTIREVIHAPVDPELTYVVISRTQYKIAFTGPGAATWFDLFFNIGGDGLEEILGASNVEFILPAWSVWLRVTMNKGASIPTSVQAAQLLQELLGIPYLPDILFHTSATRKDSYDFAFLGAHGSRDYIQFYRTPLIDKLAKLNARDISVVTTPAPPRRAPDGVEGGAVVVIVLAVIVCLVALSAIGYKVMMRTRGGGGGGGGGRRRHAGLPTASDMNVIAEDQQEQSAGGAAAAAHPAITSSSLETAEVPTPSHSRSGYSSVN